MLRMSGGVTPLREEQSWLVTASLMILAAVALAAALAYARAVMVPFVLAVFIFFLVTPFTDLLILKLRFPRWLAVLVSLLVVAGMLALLGLLITTSARGLGDSADIYRERILGLAEQLFAILDRYNLDLGQTNVLASLQQLPLGSILRTTAGTLVGLVTNGFLVLFFVIFLLLGRKPGRKYTHLYDEIDQKVKRFIVTKFLVSATTGILVGGILSIIGLELALVFGVLAFLLNFIPNVGSVVATLLPIPVALVQYDAVTPVLLVVLLPGVVQVTIGNLIEPKIMGDGLDLSPVTILLALVLWGLMWGIVGMLLAAPITAVLRIVLEQFETTKPVGEILAGRFPGEKVEA
ncbi:MAG: AI-2E family transporter [Gemmatimonadales bacterium]